MTYRICGALLALCLTGCSSLFVIGPPRLPSDSSAKALSAANGNAMAALAKHDLEDPDKRYGRAAAAVVNRWLIDMPWRLPNGTQNTVKLQPGMRLHISTTRGSTGAGSFVWRVPGKFAQQELLVQRDDFLFARFLLDRGSSDHPNFETLRKRSNPSLSVDNEPPVGEARSRAIADFNVGALRLLADPASIELSPVLSTAGTADKWDLYYETTSALLREGLYAPSASAYQGSDKQPAGTLKFKVCESPGGADCIDAKVETQKNWFYLSGPDPQGALAFSIGIVAFDAGSQRPFETHLGASITEFEREHGVKVLGIRRQQQFICQEAVTSSAPVNEGKFCSLTDLSKPDEPITNETLLSLLSSPAGTVLLSFGATLPLDSAKRSIRLPDSAKPHLLVHHGDLLYID